MPLRVAMVGTRGVPAQYGGFETAVEEIGRRLVERGHHVTVYRRRTTDETVTPRTHLGMQLVTLPALRVKVLETLSHTALSTILAVAGRRFDAVVLFNAANAPFLPAFRLRRLPVAVHVDGLEWKRSKWSGAGRNYYRVVEQLSVRWADALIADAQGIADYYTDEFAASTELISYGAPILDDLGSDRLVEFGLKPGEYHLIVARFEPENHVEMIVRGYVESSAELPLVVVGGAPYSDEYTALVHDAARRDERVRFLGPLWDQDQLDQLYGNALVYFHGHSVGGTNPSLLRAMGAGASVAAFDVSFNREVLGSDCMTFADASQVREAVESAESAPGWCRENGAGLRERAADLYDWDEVTDRYEELMVRLSEGYSRRGEVSGRRRQALDRSVARPSTALSQPRVDQVGREEGQA
ncbi:MAG: DUF1972 domain-containing protein [Microthrixaceae bacterium]